MSVHFHLSLHIKADGCLADTCDMEGGLFWMTSVLDHNIDNFSDVVNIVGGSIHVIDGDGDGEAMGVYIFLTECNPYW